MHFCAPATHYTWIKKQRNSYTASIKLGVDDFYAINLSSPIQAASQRMSPALMALQFAAEWSWWKAGRPYYNVWPGIADVLLDFNAERLSLASLQDAPEKAIALQFQHPACRGVRSIVACLMTSHRFKDLLEEGWGRQNAFAKKHGGTSFSKWQFGDPDGLVLATIEENDGEIRNPLCGSISFPTEMRAFTATWDVADRPICPKDAPLSAAQRAAVAVLIMERDPSLFTPDVLQKDEAAFEVAPESTRDELVAKAFQKRGQRGWHLGREIEISPHYRRPHLTAQPYGPGNSLRKIIVRSGCIVKRHKLTEAPTGFHGSYGEADCDMVT